MRIHHFFLLIFLSLPISGCYETEFDKIVYSFEDEVSTSPTYHRSYIITVTSEKSRIEIRNPDKILFEASFTLSEGKFQKIKLLCEKLNNESDLIWEEKCGECKTRQFILQQKTAEVYRVKWNKGSLSEQGKEALNAVKATIPRMDDLLKTTLAQD